MPSHQLTECPPGDAVLELKGVVKTYGGVRALGGVDLTVRAGTIHGLVGSNGAGKSTLIGVLSGTVVPERGEVAVAGRALPFGEPDKRQRLGLATVFQHSALAPNLSIAEAVTLGGTPTRRFGFADRHAERERARLAMEYAGLELDPSTPVERLGLGSRRLLEIGTALSADARCILLDEPTSTLTRPEAARLFEQVRQARSRGVAFIYVSHFLSEVLEISDEVTVLRDGRTVGSVTPGETSVPRLVQLMLGDKVRPQGRETAREAGEPVLRADGLGVEGLLRDGSFTLHEGEVLGFAGLKGSGVDELARALGGMTRHRGTVELAGVRVRLRSPHEALRDGIAYLPADRLREGVLVEASVRENAALSIYDRFTNRLGLVSDTKLAAAVRTELDRFGVVRRDDGMPVGQLSGGNQQKVVLARLTQAAPRVLVLHGPTIGVDVGSKRQIAQRIDELAAEGRGVVIVSDDMEELCEVCDRVLVLVGGRIVRELAGSELEPGELLVACQSVAAAVGA